MRDEMLLTTGHSILSTLLKPIDGERVSPSLKKNQTGKDLIFMKNFVLDIRKDPTKDDSASPKCEMLATDVFVDEEFRKLKPLVIEIIGDEQPAVEFEELLRDPENYLTLRNMVFVKNYLESNNLEIVCSDHGCPFYEGCANDGSDFLDEMLTFKM